MVVLIWAIVVRQFGAVAARWPYCPCSTHPICLTRADGATKSAAVAASPGRTAARWV